jgi:hypothetical protein
VVEISPGLTIEPLAFLMRVQGGISLRDLVVRKIEVVELTIGLERSLPVVVVLEFFFAHPRHICS